MTSLESGAEVELQSIARRHDLDAMRGLAMLLGIVLHGALSFTTGWWPVQDQKQDDLLGLLVAAIHGFRMPVFFMMSGFFTAMLWQKRGLPALIKQRSTRVLAPLVIALFTILPIMNIVVAYVVTDAAGDNIWTAAKANDGEAIEAYLADGADINEQDRIFGATPLSWAAPAGHAEMIGLLLENGADVGAKNKDGGTALHAAAFMGSVDGADLLLRNGADPNAANADSQTPLDSSSVDLGVTEYLAGVLGLEFDKRAIQEGRKAVAELLTAQGAEFGDPTGNREQEPLTLAPWYWETIYSDAFTISTGTDPEKAGRFNFFHTSIFHHLWFLWFLVWLVGGFAIYAWAADRFSWSSPRLPGWLALSPANLLWLIPITACLQWFMGLEGSSPIFGPDTSVGPIPIPHILLYHAVFFAFGAVYFAHKEGGQHLSRWWRIWLPLGLLVIFPLGMWLVYGDFGALQDSPAGQWIIRVPAVVLQAAFPWCMIFGLMGLFRALLESGSYVVRYISDSSYWLYLAHLPLIVLMQHMVRNWEAPAAVKLAFICIMVTALLLVLYQWGVRYTPLGTLLNGRRTRPEAPPSASR